MSEPATADTGNGSIRWYIRLLALIIIPVLVSAFIILYFSQASATQRFAWPVSPQMSAMMLGATYLGGAYFFSCVLLASRWYHVQLGFIPVTAFASILGLATLLHWENFSHGTLAFQFWALLYFTLPFILPVAWFANWRSSRASTPPREIILPQWLRLLFAGVGLLMSVASLLLFLFPAQMIPAWPWTLSPLTARILSAMFVLPGLVAVGIAVDGRWGAARYVLQAQLVAIALILVAMVRAADTIEWSHAGAWLFVGGLALVVALAVIAFATSRSAIGLAQPN